MPKPVYWDSSQSNPIGQHEGLLNLLTLDQGQPQRHLNHSDGETAEQSRFHGLRAQFLWTSFCLVFICGEWAEVFYKLIDSIIGPCLSEPLAACFDIVPELPPLGPKFDGLWEGAVSYYYLQDDKIRTYHRKHFCS